MNPTIEKAVKEIRQGLADDDDPGFGDLCNIGEILQRHFRTDIEDAARYRYVREHMMRRNAWEQTSDPDLFDARVDMGLAAARAEKGAA